jgi:hypothetical protein
MSWFCGDAVPGVAESVADGVEITEQREASLARMEPQTPDRVRLGAVGQQGSPG